MIAVDTNVIGYLFLESDRSTQAETLLLKDPNWVAPLLWRSEFRNVLAHYLRREILSLGDAIQIMEAATRLMQGFEYHTRSTQVLQLVDASSCSAYDCEFVALAQDLGISLVTVDRQILSQFPETALSLDSFVTQTGSALKNSEA